MVARTVSTHEREAVVVLAGVVQIAASIATALLMRRLASRLYGARAGSIALVAGLFFPDAIVYSVRLWPDTLFSLFTAGALVVLARHLARPSWRTAAWFGALAGIATLFKTVGVVLVPALLVATGWRSLLRRRTWIALVAYSLTLAPWVARNAIVHGAPMLGNELAFTFFWIQPNGRLKEVREAWLRLPDHRARQAAGSRALHEIFSQYPSRFFAPVGGRAALMFGWESFISKFGSGGRRFFPRLGALGNRLLVVILQIGFLALYPLALIGLFFLRDPPIKRALCGFLVLYALPCIFLGAHTRYRLPWLPALATFAAGAWTQRAEIVGGLRRPWRVAGFALAALAIAGNCYRHPPWAPGEAPPLSSVAVAERFELALLVGRNARCAAAGGRCTGRVDDAHQE
ncbi:MAG: glycosyltransferase family 39 protein [Planctomycetota bacterium]